jgi:hypothetical protein
LFGTNARISGPIAFRLFNDICKYRPFADGCGQRIAALNLKLEHQRAQRFSVRVERQRAGYPAAERALDHKVERADVRQLVTRDGSCRDRSKMAGEAFGGDSLDEERIVLRWRGPV